MKTRIFISQLLLALILVSCGTKSGQFRIEGRFRNLNQGEFYVYSPDGGISGIDTIKVADGRFAYETALEHPATFIIIFPNYSEQPVFGESGTAVVIKGDASHLKEMEIKGTKENELFTKFRLSANRLSPPEMKAAVAAFVAENPASAAGIYLTNKHFIQTAEPDYAKAYELTGLMLKAQPGNSRLALLNKRLKSMRAAGDKARMPRFAAVGTDGKKLTQAQLASKVNIVSAWASWSYESTNIQRRLKALKKTYGSELAIVSICIDASIEDCKKTLERDSVAWPTVCDGKMWDTPLLMQTGIATIPGNIIYDSKGKVIASQLNAQQIEDKIKSILKK